jgi:hypothetical protein
VLFGANSISQQLVYFFGLFNFTKISKTKAFLFTIVFMIFRHSCANMRLSFFFVHALSSIKKQTSERKGNS